MRIKAFIPTKQSHECEMTCVRVCDTRILWITSHRTITSDKRQAISPYDHLLSWENEQDDDQGTHQLHNMTVAGTDNGRYVIVPSDIPKVRAYTRSRRFAYAVNGISFQEFSAEFMPNREYRRGDTISEIPSEWLGVSFDAAFGIGGPDVDAMKSFVTIMRNNHRVVTFDWDKGGAKDKVGRHGRIDCITERNTLLKDEANDVNRTKYTPSSETKHAKEIEERLRLLSDGLARLPMLISWLEVADDKSRMVVHGDFFDGGKRLSKNPTIPSLSMDFAISKAGMGLRKFSLSSDGKTQWDYVIHMNIGPEGIKSSIKQPTVTCMKAAYLSFQRCMLRLIDYADLMGKSTAC